MTKKHLESRCSCPAHPLLAICGRTESNVGFVQIKAWKGKRLLTEAIVTSGSVSIKCRECGQWHTIVIIYGNSPQRGANPPPLEEIVSMLDEPRINV